MSDIQRITGLWQKQDKNGNTMLTGNINTETLDRLVKSNPSKILILHNYKKDKDNSPTHSLCVISDHDNNNINNSTNTNTNTNNNNNNNFTDTGEF